jgi:hypothetical protein
MRRVGVSGTRVFARPFWSNSFLLFDRRSVNFGSTKISTTFGETEMDFEQ